uniref:Uncharacterized protein n=1 Tax=Rhizophora mucronata TaxID=61149 RepID=A0A2P2PIB2_RHIMU
MRETLMTLMMCWMIAKVRTSTLMIGRRRSLMVTLMAMLLAVCRMKTLVLGGSWILILR